MPWTRDKNNPGAWRQQLTFTGSVELECPIPRRILEVRVTQIATTTPGADHFTKGPNSGDRGEKVTLYAWLNNAAAVAAVTADVTIFTE